MNLMTADWAKAAAGSLHGSRRSSRPHFQPDANLSGIVFDEMNAGLLESFLYFEDG
jgi:hypothetical protein